MIPDEDEDGTNNLCCFLLILSNTYVALLFGFIKQWSYFEAMCHIDWTAYHIWCAIKCEYEE